MTKGNGLTTDIQHRGGSPGCRKTPPPHLPEAPRQKSAGASSLKWRQRPNPSKPTRGITILRSAERMIQAHDPRLLATYYYLKLRCRNSVIYGFAPASAKKMGVSARTLRLWIPKLIAAGLCCQHGHHFRLTPILAEAERTSKRGVIRHQCTLRLRPNMRVRDIQDILHLKIFEQRHRQVTKATSKADELNQTPSETKRNKILLRWRPRRDEPVTSPFRAVNALLKLKAPSHVSMSVHHIASALDLSTASARRWKRRMTIAGLVSQIDRRVTLREGSAALMENKDLVQAAWHCSIFAGRSVYAQAPSLYRPTINYQQRLKQK